MNSIQSKQDEEVEVLRSIYDTDLQDLRQKDVWKVWRPPDLKIHLFPTRGFSGTATVRTSVDLRVKCTERYPNEAPELKLENGKGLSKQDMDHLLIAVLDTASALKGEVMLLELCQMIQNFLYERNKLPAPDGSIDVSVYQSFHQGMVERRHLQEKREASAEIESRAKAEAKETAEIKAELIRRRQKSVSEKQERKRSSSSSEKTFRPLVSTESTSPQHFHVAYPDNSVHSILNTFQHLPRQPFHPFCKEWICLDESTNQLVIIQEWAFTAKKSEDLQTIEKQIPGLEKEFQSISKLIHSHLIPYLALQIEKTESAKNALLKIIVVQPNKLGFPLSGHLESLGAIPLNQLKCVAEHLLTALDYLHTKDVLHKNLNCNSIWYIPGQGYFLSDFSLGKRLIGLVDSFVHDDVYVANSVVAGAGKPSRRSDIFMVGINLLSLAVGTWMGSRDLIPQVPEYLDSNLADLLTMCLERAGHCTVKQLLGHEFLVSESSDIKLKVVRKVRNSEEEISEENHQPFVISTSSRLKNEFEVLSFLGKGGFGDVIKVRNNLDGRFYAIKRITLNPQSKNLNKKICREVKLLSRVNHENVVRYYNSWIETEFHMSSDTTSEVTDTPKKIDNDSLLNKMNNLELDAPPPQSGSVEWSVSLSRTKRTVDLEESSSDSESDTDPLDVFGTSFYRQHSSSSEAVVFENNSKGGGETIEEIEPETPIKTESEISSQTFSQTLYIQMEFCEKSTLRQSIDKWELLGNSKRAWRLFREILEGVKYFHSLGMIHRDIKPVNVFLDAQDNVKIGDFGLATQDLLQMNETSLLASPTPNTNLTTAVGTALYVAPELIDVSPAKRLEFPQKVDIYSCGVVLFEMFYRPLEPGMERMRTLTELRNPKPFTPPDFGSGQSSGVRDKLKTLLDWLLDYDINERPTAEEILKSHLLPPLEQEETHFQSCVKNALANERSSQFKSIIDLLFQKCPSTAADYCYDKQLYQENDQFSVIPGLLSERVRSDLVEIFHRHSAVSLQGGLPFLIPKNTYDTDKTDDYKYKSAPEVVDSSGINLTLPFDLRYGFARFVARSGINRLKRYSFGKVYRYDRGRTDCHPRECTECAVDFVSCASNEQTLVQSCVTSTVELLSILSQVVEKFPFLKNCTVKLNHAHLLKSILIYSGITSLDMQSKAITLIENYLDSARKGPKTNDQSLRSVLCSELGLNDQTASGLCEFLGFEESYDKISSHLRCITKRKSGLTAANLAKEALRDLEMLRKGLENVGANMTILICPGLVYRPEIYSSGFVFRASVEVPSKRKKKNSLVTVLATGGRYDGLINSLQKPMDPKLPDFMSLCAVGISIAFDRIVASLDVEEHAFPNFCDLLICSVGGSMTKEKMILLKELWKINVKTDFLHEPIDDLEQLQNSCRQKGIKKLLILFESGVVSLRSLLDKERKEFLDKKISIPEAIQQIKESVSSDYSSSAHHYSSVPDLPPATATFANMNINYLVLEKPAYNTRKRFETQIRNALSGMVGKFSPKITVEVLATDLPSSVLNTVASSLEWKSEEGFKRSTVDIGGKYGKFKKDLRLLFDGLRNVLIDLSESELQSKVVIVFSIPEDYYRVIL